MFALGFFFFFQIINDINKQIMFLLLEVQNLLKRLEVGIRENSDIHIFCSFLQAADEPAYLTVGTEVSAKYRGAFCEAKIKTVKRLVKVKVIFLFNATALLTQLKRVGNGETANQHFIY